MNRRTFSKRVATLAASLPVAWTTIRPAAEKSPVRPPRVAVITGGHNFDVPGFHQLFRSLAGVDAYIQHLDDFACASESARDNYDVVLFYLMFRETPVDEGQPWYRGQPSGVWTWASPRAVACGRTSIRTRTRSMIVIPSTATVASSTW